MGHAIRERIAQELIRLGAQRRRYLVAMQVAEHSATLRKRIRAVQRLDDEIAARKEVLKGLPPPPSMPEPGFRLDPESSSEAIELDGSDLVLVA